MALFDRISQSLWYFYYKKNYKRKREKEREREGERERERERERNRVKIPVSLRNEYAVFFKNARQIQANRDNPPSKTKRSRLSISDPIKSERIWKTALELARQHITHRESCLSAWFPRRIPRRLRHGINSNV